MPTGYMWWVRLCSSYSQNTWFSHATNTQVSLCHFHVLPPFLVAKSKMSPDVWCEHRWEFFLWRLLRCFDQLPTTILIVTFLSPTADRDLCWPQQKTRWTNIWLTLANVIIVLQQLKYLFLLNPPRHLRLSFTRKLFGVTCLRTDTWIISFFFLASVPQTMKLTVNDLKWFCSNWFWFSYLLYPVPVHVLELEVGCERT